MACRSVAAGTLSRGRTRSAPVRLRPGSPSRGHRARDQSKHSRRLQSTPHIVRYPATVGGGQSIAVGLDTAIPARMAINRGATLYIAGWCFHESRPIRHVCFVVDGEEQPVMASNMPRRGIVAHSSSSKRTKSWRGGFWGHALLRTRDAAHVTDVSLRVRAGSDVVDHRL